MNNHKSWASTTIARTQLLIAFLILHTGAAAESISYSCKEFRYPTIDDNINAVMDSASISRHKISFREDLALNPLNTDNCDSLAESNHDSSVILVNWKCLGYDNGFFGATNSYLLKVSTHDKIDTLFRLRNLGKIHRAYVSHDTIRLESAHFYGKKTCMILHEYIEGKTEKLCPTICEEESETVEFKKDEFSGILKRTKRYLQLSKSIARMNSKEYARRKNHFKHNYYSP